MGLDNRMGQIIEFILEDADETLSKESDRYNYIELLTYAHVLKIIQEQLSDEERKAFKLDFDIDKKYM